MFTTRIICGWTPKDVGAPPAISQCSIFYDVNRDQENNYYFRCWGTVIMGHNSSRIRCISRGQGLFLPQSCHRAAGCWRSPQKTPLHLGPRTKTWLDSHETTRSKASGQNCPIPVEMEQGVKIKKGFNTSLRNSLLKKKPTLYLQSSPPDSIWSLTEFQSTFRTSPSWAFHWRDSRREKTILCQCGVYNFFL